MIEVWSIGGYSEIGRNMTGVVVDDEAVILDMGLNMDKVVNYTGDDMHILPYDEMLKLDVIADDSEFRKKHGKKVKAIVCGHAHLDHIGAVPVVAKKYNAPIIATPFTLEIVKSLYERRKIRNKLIQMKPREKKKLSDNITIEFVHITHSTPQTVIIVIHTKYGKLIYANDYKLDDTPVLGKKPDYVRLKELSREGVLLFLCDTTRVETEGKTPSESEVVKQLEKIFENDPAKGKAIFATFFASHIERLSTFIKEAKKLKRTPIILGRSLSTYVGASIRLGIYDPKCEVYGYKKQIAKKFRQIRRNRGDYLVILTGNQGEPDAMLSQVIGGNFDFELQKGDVVVIASKIIPTPSCEKNREILEERLKMKEASVYTNIHSSGHASREDLRKILNILKPKHFIPTHGGLEKITSAAELSEEEGYVKGETVHILQNGDKKVF